MELELCFSYIWDQNAYRYQLKTSFSEIIIVWLGRYTVIVWERNNKFRPKFEAVDIVFFSAEYASLGCI